MTDRYLSQAEIKAIVERLPRHGLFEVDCEVDHAMQILNLHVRFRGGVPDMDSGVPRNVHVGAVQPVDRPKSQGELLFHLRKALRELCLHEVDEWIRLDGVPVYTPHAPFRRPDDPEPLHIRYDPTITEEEVARIKAEVDDHMRAIGLIRYDHLP